MDLQKRGIGMILLVYLLFSLSRVKPPNDWAVTHFLLSYDLGTTRRSLFGQVLQPFLNNGLTPGIANVFAVLLTVGAGLALVAFMARALLRCEGGVELLLVFATSFALAVFLSNTGYLDGGVALAGVAALMLPVRGVLWIGAKIGLCVMAVLLHEVALPGIVLLVGLQLFLAGEGRLAVHQIAIAALPVIVAGLVVFVLFKSSPLAATQLDPVIAALNERSGGVTVFSDVVEAVMRFANGSAPEFDWIWESGRYQFEFRYVLPIGFGFALLMLAMALRLIRHRTLIDKAVVIAVALGPFSVLFVAFDISRLVALGILHVFLLIAVILERDVTARANLRQVFPAQLIMVLLVVNVLVVFPPLNAMQLSRVGFPYALGDLPMWQP